MTDRPTREELLEMFDYDPKTGIILRRKDYNAGLPAGSTPGSLDENGYRRISIRARRYRAHHLIWVMMTGHWPGRLDHKETDGPKADFGNRWSNLRLASNTDNSRNSRVGRNNLSGYTGVWWDSQRRKWKAKIYVGQRQIHLGFFDDIEMAAAARRSAEIEYFGEFAPVPTDRRRRA